MSNPLESETRFKPEKTQLKRSIASQIFSIQNTLRGASGIEPNDFKNFILGFLFYRYLSEDFAAYVDSQSGLDKSYQDMIDQEVEEWKEELTKEKGYFIKPSQLFTNMAEQAPRNESLNEHLSTTFDEIESSSYGSASEEDFRGLFDDVDMNSKAIGVTVVERNRTLSELMTKVNEIDLGGGNSNVDILGDVYEMLISDYASSAGKRGGEFYTPQEVSQILVRLTMLNRKENETRKMRVYDPTCGSGSLLLKFLREQESHVSQYYGQELKHVTFNLARMNFFMHGIPFEKFNIGVGDTLRHPHFRELAGQMDAVVANPPYSIKWDGDQDPILSSDERFTPAGRLAPKGKADLAFVMHCLYMLAPSGTAAIVEFPTVLSRGGAEKDIRKYLIDNDYIDTIIQLPENLFFGTSIATCIIVLRKNKSEDLKDKTLFIDASSMFEKATNMNVLRQEDQDEIIKLAVERKNIEYKSALVDKEEISKNDYTLSVSKYVVAEDTREKIDIELLENEIDQIVMRQEKVRQEIQRMVKGEVN
jgi:type I restriction enzyme M protein